MDQRRPHQTTTNDKADHPAERRALPYPSGGVTVGTRMTKTVYRFQQILSIPAYNANATQQVIMSREPEILGEAIDPDDRSVDVSTPSTLTWQSRGRTESALAIHDQVKSILRDEDQEGPFSWDMMERYSTEEEGRTYSYFGKGDSSQSVNAMVADCG